MRASLAFPRLTVQATFSFDETRLTIESSLSTSFTAPTLPAPDILFPGILNTGVHHLHSLLTYISVRRSSVARPRHFSLSVSFSTSPSSITLITSTAIIPIRDREAIRPCRAFSVACCQLVYVSLHAPRMTEPVSSSYMCTTVRVASNFARN